MAYLFNKYAKLHNVIVSVDKQIWFCVEKWIERKMLLKHVEQLICGD